MGIFFAAQATRGPEDAAYAMTFQYCGAWGYNVYADEIIAKVDAWYPGQFKYALNKDAGMTGRLEVTLQKGTGPAEMVHTKKGGQGLTNEDWTGFETRLKESMAKINLWVLLDLS